MHEQHRSQERCIIWPIHAHFGSIYLMKQEKVASSYFIFYLFVFGFLKRRKKRAMIN